MPLRCGVPPTITTDATVLNTLGAVVPGPAQVGDAIKYSIGVTNPDTEAVTIGSFSATIDPALLELGWTATPAEAFGSGGPCTFSSGGVLTCSGVTLAAGASFIVELTSSPITAANEACSTYTMSASIAAGQSSSPASVTIQCPPKIVKLPAISLGNPYCVDTQAMTSMSLGGQENIEVYAVVQDFGVVLPDTNGAYQIKEGSKVTIIFEREANHTWPSPLPILFTDGFWDGVEAYPAFNFTPVFGDCQPRLQITKTFVDSSGNPIPAGTVFAPGDFHRAKIEVTNIGISTITGLQYENMLPFELRWRTLAQVIFDIPHSGGQTCTDVCGNFLENGYIRSELFGANCTMSSPQTLTPGSSLNFLLAGQVTSDPTAAECANGIPNSAVITSVNGVTVNITSEPLLLLIACEGEPNPLPLVHVSLVVTDGISLTGSPWKLYAPTASRAEPPVYDQGVVGQNNKFVFNKETVDGQYRLVIEPAGKVAIVKLVDITNDGSELVVYIDIVDDVETPTPTPTATTPPDSSPTATTPSDSSPTAITPSDSSPTATTPSDSSPTATTPPDSSPTATTPPDSSPGETPSPTVQPPASKTSQPAATSGAVVTALPDTGIGERESGIHLLIAGLTMAGLVVMLFGVRNGTKTQR